MLVEGKLEADHIYGHDSSDGGVLRVARGVNSRVILAVEDFIIDTRRLGVVYMLCDSTADGDFARNWSNRTVPRGSLDFEFVFSELCAGRRPLEDGIAVGDWVVTTDFVFRGLEDVVVPGMLGQVVPDPRERCIPGVGAMVQLCGIARPFGYPKKMLAVCEPPSPSALADAEELAKRALEVYQDQHCWLGLVPLGKKVLPESQVKRELATLVAQLKNHSSLPEADAKGRWKRVRKLLRAVSEQGKGAEAGELARAAATLRWDKLSPEFIAHVTEYTRSESVR